MPLYLGLDCSTQSFTAVVIGVERGERSIVLERSLSFDEALPQYGTERGVRRSGGDPCVVFAPPLMWIDALDELMSQVARALGGELSRLEAVCGSAQQHGSVYLNAGWLPAVAALHPRAPVGPQLRGVLARTEAPVWMDSSTSTECGEIAAAVGGDAALARLTGSRAFERFTGPQIRRFFKTRPDAYAATARIHLVSSFLASVLAGADAPIDHGDGSGMNLMDIRQRRWASVALEATAPGLLPKLPALAPSWTRIGFLAPYWHQRHGFPPADVVAWSGDNPCSLVGTGMVREGRLAISLGTSDTVFGLMRQPNIDASGAGSVFASPTGDYMGLTCFSNGSLARERVRSRYGLTWDQFSDVLRLTPPGNRGALMLPWFEPEITPTVAAPAVRRRRLSEDDGDANVRAVVEAQVLSMKRHSAWMGVRVESLYATGGASANREILRVMADVFDADVYQFEVSNSAALGAALRAYHAAGRARGRDLPWEDVAAGFAEPMATSRITPVPENVRVYDALGREHAAFEARALADERSS